VIDKNDNGPEFTLDPKWFNILENTDIGEPIGNSKSLSCISKLKIAIYLLG